MPSSFHIIRSHIITCEVAVVVTAEKKMEGFNTYSLPALPRQVNGWCVVCGREIEVPHMNTE